MNERIKELVEQANGPNPFYGTLKNQLCLLGDDAVEKFAELIIKETLQVARAGIEFGDGMEDAVYKYFGVEE